jgi:hypothetical protein
MYNRNSNLNSHIRIFWGSQVLNTRPEWGFLERGITTGLNAQVENP